MVRLILTRFNTGSKKATTGNVVAIDDISGEILLSLPTLELPWVNNENNVSCIPKGIYPIKKWNISGKFNYEHFLLEDVPDRSQVKIHRGNFTRQIHGCILPGLTHADIDGDGIRDVTYSRIALNKLLEVMPARSTITII
jgi:hypothetical protein